MDRRDIRQTFTNLGGKILTQKTKKKKKTQNNSLLPLGN